MSKIGNEYAMALFMLARENGKEDEYAEGLRIVCEVFLENPEYIDLISSPEIPIDTRMSLLDEAFLKTLPEDVLVTLKLLTKKGQIKHINECALSYEDMLNKLQKVSIAKVTSAVELTSSQKESLKMHLEKISGNKVILDFNINEEIIGGVIVEIDGKIMDSSVCRYLKDLKDVIRG